MRKIITTIILPLFLFTFALAQDAAPEAEAAAEEVAAEEVATPEEAPADADATEEAAPEDSVAAEETTVAEAAVEEPASPLAGFSVGAAPSIGFISGETFTNIPVGATVVITTPYGFKLGPLDFTISAAFGGYAGSFDNDAFNPTIAGIGGNLTLANFVFAEGHAGMVGSGTGVRGFAGVTSSFIMKKLNKGDLSLPFNLLVGGEGFISTDMAGAGNPSFWGGLGVRLDYSF